MMLSIFQSLSIPSMWLRWVKWRGWWQTESKLRECPMKRRRRTARPVCTLIVSALVYCHLPNDQPLRSGIVKWILSCYSVISSSGSHWAGLSLCLWFFEWFHHIFSCTVHLSIYVRTQLIIFIQKDLSLTMSSVTTDVWCVECYSMLSLRPWSHFNM